MTKFLNMNTIGKFERKKRLFCCWYLKVGLATVKEHLPLSTACHFLSKEKLKNKNLKSIF